MSIYYDAQEKMSASAVQYVRGMPVVKIFGQSVRSFRQFNAEIQAYKTFALKCCDTYQNGMIAFTVLLNSMVTFILPMEHPAVASQSAIALIGCGVAVLHHHGAGHGFTRLQTDL